MKAPWRYAPEGDSDGYTLGVDHFVVDANGDEVVLAKDEESGRLIGAATDLLLACELWDQGFVDGEDFTSSQLLKWMNDNRRAARAAIAKARGTTTTV